MFCTFCNKKFEFIEPRWKYHESSKYRWDSSSFCSYECSRNHRLEKRKKTIEERYGSMGSFNNWELRRILKELRDQGISNEGIEAFKNGINSFEKICEECSKSYKWDGVRIHKIEGKKKGYNASRFCSWECCNKNKWKRVHESKYTSKK